MSRAQQLIARAQDGFQAAFGSAPSQVYRAPGRVNLIGEHVDYNEGFVLPCAIDRETIVALAPSPDAAIEAVALDMDGARDSFSLEGSITRSEGEWQNHIRGVAHFLRQRGVDLKPARIAIAGDIPRGAGMSSSASLGVAVALALSANSGLTLSPADLATIAQQAENDFVGCACGIMDQMASAANSAGSALMLDCRSLEYRPAPISSDLAIVAIDSGIRRQLVDSGFNERRAQCEQAAQHYGVASLRDLSNAQLEAGRGDLDQTVYARARHVVSEIERVEPFAAALAKGDTSAIASLMRASHASLRDDFEVSLPAIDSLADTVAEALGDTGGVRLTGAGFGGCLVAVVEQNATARVVEAVEQRFNPSADTQAAVMVMTPSAGAGPVPTK